MDWGKRRLKASLPGPARLCVYAQAPLSSSHGREICPSAGSVNSPATTVWVRAGGMHRLPSSASMADEGIGEGGQGSEGKRPCDRKYQYKFKQKDEQSPGQWNNRFIKCRNVRREYSPAPLSLHGAIH